MWPGSCGSQPPEPLDDSREASSERIDVGVGRSTSRRSPAATGRRRRPSPASTGDGSSVSLEHDEPECTATPCWLRASRTGSASTPAMPTHTRWGSAAAGSPNRSTPSTAVAAVVSRVVSTMAALGLGAEATGLGELGRRGAEPDDRGHVLEAAAPGPLLRAAEHERREAQSASHEERGGARRRAPGVPGDGAQIGAERGEVDRRRGRRPRTRRRGRAPRASASRHAAMACDVLERADLVVRELDRHQRGVGRRSLRAPRRRRRARGGRRPRS